MANEQTSTSTTDAELMARMRVNVPAKKSGRIEIAKFTVPPGDPGMAYYGPRAPEPGDYTKLQEYVPGHEQEGFVWMSDTTAELLDHLPAARRIADPSTRRVLINGLGLGCLATLALSFDHVEHVDVVEQDQRVIKLVGNWLNKEHGDQRLWVLPRDAYQIGWPHGTSWDVIWHDIWPSIGSDNLRGMHQLHQKYADHCGWQGIWSLEQSMTMQDQERLLVQEVVKMDGKLPEPGHEVWDSYQEFVDLEQDYAYFVEQGYHATSPEDLYPEGKDMGSFLRELKRSVR